VEVRARGHQIISASTAKKTIRKNWNFFYYFIFLQLFPFAFFTALSKRVGMQNWLFVLLLHSNDLKIDDRFSYLKIKCKYLISTELKAHNCYLSNRNLSNWSSRALLLQFKLLLVLSGVWTEKRERKEFDKILRFSRPDDDQTELKDNSTF